MKARYLVAWAIVAAQFGTMARARLERADAVDGAWVEVPMSAGMLNQWRLKTEERQ